MKLLAAIFLACALGLAGLAPGRFLLLRARWQEHNAGTAEQDFRRRSDGRELPMNRRQRRRAASQARRKAKA